MKIKPSVLHPQAEGLLPRKGKQMNKLLPVSLLCISTVYIPSVPATTLQEPAVTAAYTDNLATHKKININLLNQTTSGNIKSWSLNIPDAREISLTLNNVLLPSGTRLEVSDGSGGQKTIYNDKMFYDGTKPQLTTSPIPGTNIVISLTTKREIAAEGNIIIDSYQYIPVKKSRAIIGTNQMKFAGCYKKTSPEFYANSHAIMVVNGGGTGWNLTGGPYVITNQHVAGNARPVSVSLKYNYQYPDCSPGDLPEESLTIHSEAVTIAGTGTNDDWAVLKADDLAYQEAGIRQIFGTLVINSDTDKEGLLNIPVYVPQHPWASLKRIASTGDDGEACTTLAGGNAYRLYHSCDTAGGSSGSPLISQQDNRVIGLHRAAGNGKNVSIPGPYIYQKIKTLLPDANNLQAVTRGEGKVMVRSISQYPMMPSAPIDLQAEVPVKITALYNHRLTDKSNYTVFNARVRGTDGVIQPAIIRIREQTPCGTGNLTEQEKCTTAGKRYLMLTIDASDNPALNSFTGWVTLQITDTDGQRLHNLIMPIEFQNYDPFTSPFGNDSTVKKYTLTARETLTTDEISLSSNFGFVAVNPGQGPQELISGGTGYSKVAVQVKDENGGTAVINLRANRKTSCSPSLRPMNSTTGCGATKPAALVMSFHHDDNKQLASGSYQGIFPAVAQRGNEQQPVLVQINITQ